LVNRLNEPITRKYRGSAVNQADLRQGEASGSVQPGGPRSQNTITTRDAKQVKASTTPASVAKASVTPN